MPATGTLRGVGGEAFLPIIRRGVIVADKGFPSSASEPYRKENPDLHQLNPIKRNSKFIETHGLYEYDGVLPGREGITYRKAMVKGARKWLYSDRDATLAAR